MSYNLSTALRQTWMPMTALPFWGILIVWDRIFGTFQGETERPRYGLTENIRTFRPTRVAFHEFADLARDVRAAGSRRERLVL